jgi:hypothetical protein
MKVYMLGTVAPSIIRSSSMYTQQWYISYRFADSLRAGSGWNPASVVFHCTHSNGIYHTVLQTACEQDQVGILHQELFTVHTAMVYVIQFCRQLASRIKLESCIRSFSLYTQQWYMSYSFADSLRAGSGWNPDRARKLSAKLWHIPLLCVH